MNALVRVAVVIGASLLAVNGAAAQRTVIRAGRLLDVKTGQVSHDRLIIIENGRMSEVRGNDAAPQPGDSRKVIAHDVSLGGVRAALRAGVAGLAHAAYLDWATAVMVRDRGVLLIPTLASLAGDTSAASRALLKSTALAHRVGVQLVFGTDGGVLPHGDNAQEFAVLVRAGVSVLDGIRAATINAATALGLADSLGIIAPGMVADIIALEDDPVRDAPALQRIRFVMTRGKVVRRN